MIGLRRLPDRATAPRVPLNAVHANAGGRMVKFSGIECVPVAAGLILPFALQVPRELLRAFDVAHTGLPVFIGRPRVHIAGGEDDHEANGQPLHRDIILGGASRFPSVPRPPVRMMRARRPLASSKRPGSGRIEGLARGRGGGRARAQLSAVAGAGDRLRRSGGTNGA